MSYTFRHIASALWRRLTGRRSSSPPSGWFGNYPSWSAAAADAEGYDDVAILNKVRASLLEVKEGRAAFERDSVAFAEMDHEPVILENLQRIAAAGNNELRVIDFGGSLGSTYFQYKKLLKDCRITSWLVVEQEHFVNVGNTDFADGVLRFSPELPAQSDANVLLLFSVLPYIDEPVPLIMSIQRLGIPEIIIDRTGIIDGDADRITLQIVPPSVYKASYPARFFSEQKLLAEFNEYLLIQKFESKFAAAYRLEDGVTAHWCGYILTKHG